MAASINLTSSFASGSQIPSNARDNVFCTGANDSPALQWTLGGGLSSFQVQSYTLICIDVDAAGSGPGGKFVHWKVTDIPANLFSIGASQNWPVPVTIFPTDYGSGDRTNGWHGPCPPALHNYQIYVEAIILPEQIEKVGIGVVRSNLFLFTDDPQTDIPTGEPSPLSCDSCPEGFTYNETTGLCESTDSQEAVWTGATIPIIAGCRNANYSAKGLRLYQDITNYTLPIVTPNNPFGNGSYSFGPTNPYGFPNQFRPWTTNTCGPLPAGSDPTEWLGQTSSCPTNIQNPNDIFVNNREADFWLHDSSGLNTPLEILVGEASADNPANLSGLGQPPFRSSLWGLDYDIQGAINCIDPGITGAQYNGRLNNAGIWSDPTNSGDNPCITPNAFTNTGVTFEFCVNLEQSKQYLIGLGGDNTARIYVDGSLVVDIETSNGVLAPFRYWHVFPVTLTAGQHIITLEGYNRDGAASFAGEIYDITLQEFQNTLLLPADSGNPSFPDSATCGNVYEDLFPYIIFTTQSYIDSGIPDLADTQGEWLCGTEVVGDDVCGTTPLCSSTVTVEPLPCCYQIQSCNNPEDVYLISLDESVEQLPLELNTVYRFSGDTALTDQGCFQLIDFINCDGGELVNIVVEETVGDTCDACIPCYELTDCEDPENTVIIQWDPEAAPLEEGTSYVFDFDPTKCWSAELQFSPCQGTLYTTENIVTTYVDCEECLKPCYKLIDCEDDLGCCIDIKVYNGPGYGEATLTTPSGAFGNGQPYWQFELINPAPPLGDGLPTGFFVELSQVNGAGDWKLYEIPVIPSVPNSGTEIFTAIENPTIANCPSDLPISAWVAVFEEWDNAETNPCVTGGGEGYPTISTENTVFEVYVGKVIQWQDQLGETHCATVEKYTCKDETWPAEPIVVLDCFDTCEECLPKPVPEPIFELDSRSVRPGYNTPGCPPEYYEKVKCKFSEAVYQEMLSKRYGIETCCDIDERKYEIKHELLKLDATKTPYLCNPICATYSFSVYLNDGDTAEVQYVDCEGVEQTISILNFEGIYAPEICALTTLTPVITITRANSSIEQYKFETSYNVCCPVVPEYFLYEFRIEQFSYDSVVINYRNEAGEDLAINVPGCVPGKEPCPEVVLEFCAEYGSITIDTFGTGIVYAANEDCLFGSGCIQDPRLTRLGDCP